MNSSDDIFKHALRRLVGRTTAKKIVDGLKTNPRENSPAQVQAWVDLANAMLEGGQVSESEHLLLATFAVEGIHSERWLNDEYPELKIISEKMADVERQYGLTEGQYWLKKDAPSEYQILSDQYDAAIEIRFIETLRELGLDDFAELKISDPTEYDRRREIGRLATFEKDNSKKSVSSLIGSFEREAYICAEAEAFYAACVMLGSATEARLLDACLNRSGEVALALSALPKEQQPKQNNPLNWSLENLVNVSSQAGWIGAIEDDSIVISVSGWLSSLRETRNLLHPGRHARKKPHISIGPEDYSDALLSYRALCITLERNSLADMLTMLDKSE
ncbi:MAG: hypothetical protein Q7T68_07195 [Sphingopyxis sp.]|nr:hypothetical protein [Sphingopyxis sp.]